MQGQAAGVWVGKKVEYLISQWRRHHLIGDIFHHLIGGSISLETHFSVSLETYVKHLIGDLSISLEYIVNISLEITT